jgi:hypothetical protein
MGDAPVLPAEEPDDEPPEPGWRAFAGCELAEAVIAGNEQRIVLARRATPPAELACALDELVASHGPLVTRGAGMGGQPPPGQVKGRRPTLSGIAQVSPSVTLPRVAKAPPGTRSGRRSICPPRPGISQGRSRAGRITGGRAARASRNRTGRNDRAGVTPPLAPADAALRKPDSWEADGTGMQTGSVWG